MKLTLLIVTMGLLCCAFAASAAELPSLLTNPDCSLDKDGDLWPDDWPKTQGVTWEAENGVRFLRFKAETPGKMTMLYRRINLPNPPPAALDIRFRLRYAGVEHGKEQWHDARVFAHFKDLQERVLRPEPAMPNYLGSSDGWVAFNTVVRVPKGAAYLEVMPVLFEVKRGTLDLALCQVLPATAYLLPTPTLIPSPTLTPQGALPPELHVDGNQLKTPDGQSVWLQGLCVDSLEWSAAGERIDRSIPVAIDGWKANVIRLPVSGAYWFGRGQGQEKDGGLAYRHVVDAAIATAAGRGAYVALDLHRFGAPLQQDVDFWRDAATRYRNHPAVLFELFNEPHTLTWQEWRDGGPLQYEAFRQEANDDEVISPGMQGLLDTVRAAGAGNVVIAGGLDWSYDLTGVAGDFALQERPGGRGIVYSSHIYPWKTGWQEKVLVAADRYPLFIGEVGCLKDWQGFEFIPESARITDLDQWPPDVLGMIQQYRLHWAGFSFHPTCGPNVIADWDYTPTPFWGVYVKDALAGKAFAMKKLR